MTNNQTHRVDILAHEFYDGEVQAVVLSFETDKPAHQVTDLVKQAVTDYLNTPAGQEHLNENCDMFNWGDVADIPKEYFAPYGLTLHTPIIPDITVDKNEQLT